METKPYLKSMKSGCFMLVACLTLILGTTACSNEDFGIDFPEQEKNYTKQELIEQALSRMTHTKAGDKNLVWMVTIKDSVIIQCRVNEEVTIYWEDTETTMVTPNSHVQDFSYTYTDGRPSHAITIIGNEQAIKELYVNDNELILLEFEENVSLTDLYCNNNHLDEIDLSVCPKLELLYAVNNDLVSLDLTYMPDLISLYVSENRLTHLDLSQNSQVMELYLSNNRLKNLDVSMNLEVYILDVSYNPLTELKLPASPELLWLDASYTQLTDLDLSANVDYILYLLLENVPLKILNNQPLDSASFAVFTTLWNLNVAYSSLTSLDLSKNTMLSTLDIPNSDIKQLNISNTRLQRFYAAYSDLTDLIFGGYTDLENLNIVRIERTPFENRKWESIKNFFNDFPDRTDKTPGHLYTYTTTNMDKFSTCFREKNWLINQ